MRYTAIDGDTYRKIARVYTGQTAYGAAIFADNNPDSEPMLPNEDLDMTAGATYTIRDGWLLPVWRGAGDQTGGPISIDVIGGTRMPVTAQTGLIMGMTPTTLMLVGLGVLALAMWSQKK